MLQHKAFSASGFWVHKIRLVMTLLCSLGLFSGLLTATSYAERLTHQEQVEPNMAGKLAVVGAQVAELYAKPGGTSRRALTLGSMLTATGRSRDSHWVWVSTDDNASGWVEAQALVLIDLDQLPVMGEETPGTALTPTPATMMTLTRETPLIVDLTPTISSALSPTPAPAVVAGSGPQSTRVDDSQLRAMIRIAEGRVNIRAAPTLAAQVLAKGSPGQRFVALARNNSSDWVKVQLTETDFGWIYARYVQLNVAVTQLPIAADANDVPMATPLATPTGSVKPTLSNLTTQRQPNGQSIVSIGLHGKLVIQTGWGETFYLYDLASGGLKPLDSGFDPAFSPNGKAVAYTREGNETGVYIINTDGRNTHRIFGERQTLRSPKWSPDGQWLVFSRADGRYECRALEVSGLCPSAQELAAKAPHVHLDAGQLPPNCDAACQKAAEDEARKKVGRKIVNEFDAVTKPNWMLARIRVSGEDYRDLPVLNSALAPDWSTAGIVYQSTGGLQKVTDRADAQSQRVFLDNYLVDPDWQPGGGRIVFQRKQGDHWEIFAVNPDGSGLAALTRPVTALVEQLPSNVSPAWSPDGQFIVYLSNREENNSAGRWRIWVMNADGSNQHPLPVDLSFTYNFADEQMVDWGP